MYPGNKHLVKTIRLVNLLFQLNGMFLQISSQNLFFPCTGSGMKWMDRFDEGQVFIFFYFLVIIWDLGSIVESRDPHVF